MELRKDLQDYRASAFGEDQVNLAPEEPGTDLEQAGVIREQIKQGVLTQPAATSHEKKAKEVFGNLFKFQDAMTALWRNQEDVNRMTAGYPFALALFTLGTVVATSMVQTLVIFGRNRAFSHQMVLPIV